MKLVKVTVVYLVSDEGEEGAPGMRKAFDDKRLDLDDIAATAESCTVTFEDVEDK